MSSQTVALDLAQIVVLGGFNPLIIRPDWLVEQEICREDDYRGYDFPDGEAGEGVFVFADLQWEVDYDKVVLSRRDGDSGGLAEPIKQILAKLPHTPVDAVGHNFHYSQPAEGWDGPGPQLGGLSDPSADGVKPAQTRWFAEYDFPGVRVATSCIRAKDEGLIVWLFNHQRDCEQGTRSALEAVGRFEDDLDLTERLLTDTYRVAEGQ